MFNRDTKIDLTAAVTAAVRYIEQAFEVLFGELVELQHVPMVLGPIQRFECKDRCAILRRSVQISGTIVLYPSNLAYDFTVDFSMVKKDKQCAYTRWEVEGCADFHLKPKLASLSEASYVARWEYSSGLYPEVRIIQIEYKFEGTSHFTWKVGRDCTERHEEPLFPVSKPAAQAAGGQQTVHGGAHV